MSSSQKLDPCKIIGQEMIDFYRSWSSQLMDFYPFYSDEHAALRLLTYSLDRLTARFEYYVRTTVDFDEEVLGRDDMDRSLELEYGDERVLTLKDSIESVHEQIYASVTSLWMFVDVTNERADLFSGSSYPKPRSSKNFKFLKYLKSHNSQLNLEANFLDDLDEVMKSSVFRSSFIVHYDHENLRLHYDTLNKDTDFRILYFSLKENGTPPERSPYRHVDFMSDDFAPPIDCKSWSLSPCVEDAVRAAYSISARLVFEVAQKTFSAFADNSYDDKKRISQN